VLRNIEKIIREEMNAAGAIEVLLPALQPVELWKRGPRYDAARHVMFTAQSASRRSLEADTILGPTHEEVITDLVAGWLSSYRQLPVTLYQIQTKFRDEIRPRFGLMRGREFIMKDAYSFDTNSDAATRSYEAMYEAYARIFRRMGLNAFAVEADTGVMGGSFSHEFVVPCAVGESEIAATEDGMYAAAIEKAVSLPHPRENPRPGLLEKFPTPGCVTISDLEKLHGIPATDQIKTLVYMADGKHVIFLVRGDHELNEAKAAASGFEELRPATPEEIISLMKCPAGSLGAVKPLPQAVWRVIADDCLRDQHGMTTGANEEGFHIRNVSVARDLRIDEFRDIRTARNGELHPATGRPLRITRAIELGHVFKLGTKYSEALSARYLDAEGRSQPAYMGCYGIGVTRCLQAIIEQHHDSDGICWPFSVAPWHVALLLLDDSLRDIAAKIETQLESVGISVLVDDRAERPGVKFKDADLLGLPLRLTLGEKSLKSGGVELKLRTSRNSEIVPVEKIVLTVQKTVADALNACS
jgi:prolyl-tRNA synthetase